ncbi:MAG: cytochrome b/b6 domain-containing protein [Vicinamibacterales bacterium]
MDASVQGSHAAAVRSLGTGATRHAALVRVTHWVTTLAVLALLVTGAEIVVSHPRFYWGDEGNVNTPALFQLPIPSSREAVPTGYDYVLPDQNGWSRSLHFEAAWALVLAGLLYGVHGLVSGHFRRDLLPSPDSLRPAAFARSLASHLRFTRPGPEEAWSYNPVQRLAYLGVVFVLVPLMVWTGLAMSPAVVSALPGPLSVFGGHQSARTLHFAATILLTAFVVVHVVMVIRAGFGNRTRAMLTGAAVQEEDR